MRGKGLAGKGLTYRSSHSYLMYAGNEAVYLGTVPLAPDGSFAVEVPANTAIAFQVVDAEGRSELNQMSWIYVKPGETRGCIGCHKPRENSSHYATGSAHVQAIMTTPVKLTGQGEPQYFRGNNPAVTGLMELQFDRFREVAGLNRQRGDDRTGTEEVAALIRMVPTDPDRALFPASDDMETLVGRVVRRSGRKAEVVDPCLNVLGDPLAKPSADIKAAIGDIHEAWAGTASPLIRAAQILSVVTRDQADEPRVRAAFERCRALPNDIQRVYQTGIPVVTRLPDRHWSTFYLARTLGQIASTQSVASLRAALDDFPGEAASGRPDPLGVGVHFLHNDPTPCWRAASAWALGRIGDSASSASLLAVLGNTDNALDVRHAAAVSLARTAGTADLPAMRELIGKTGEVSIRDELMRSCEAVQAK